MSDTTMTLERAVAILNEHKHDGRKWWACGPPDSRMAMGRDMDSPDDENVSRSWFEAVAIAEKLERMAAIAPPPKFPYVITADRKKIEVSAGGRRPFLHIGLDGGHPQIAASFLVGSGIGADRPPWASVW